MTLVSTISVEDVEEVVKGLAKNKSFGPNGFMVNLFNETWPFMGQDTLEVVGESHKTQKVHPTLNSSFVDLIPISAQYEEPEGF